MSIARWSVVLSSLSLIACAGPAKPTVDIAAEERAIHRLTDSIAGLEVKRDLEAVLSFYAPDAILQIPGVPSLVGREAARPVVKEFFALPFTDEVMKDRTVVVAASGDLAYDIGVDNLITKTATGQTVETGKSIIIYRKIGGEWKVVANSYSTDAAAPPMPATTSSSK
jgi:uncharacterized protein (TIGR02246 family)